MREKLDQNNVVKSVFLIFENRRKNIYLNNLKEPWASEFWSEGSGCYWFALFQNGESAIFEDNIINNDAYNYYKQTEVILVKDTQLNEEEVRTIKPLLRDKQLFVVWHNTTDKAVYDHNFALFEKVGLNINGKIGQSHTPSSVYNKEVIELYKICLDQNPNNEEAYHKEIEKLKERFRYREEIDLIKQLTIIGKYKASGKLNCNISTPEQHAEKVFKFDKLTLDWRNFEPKIDKKIVKMLSSDAKTYEIQLNELRNELLPIE
jgi:hypothetical protein